MQGYTDEYFYSNIRNTQRDLSKKCNWDFATSMESTDLSINDSYQVPTNLTINGYCVSRYKF